MLPEATTRRVIIREQWSQANELFHNVILAAANCPPLRDTVQSLANRVPRSLAWHTFGDDPGIIVRSIEDHDRIAELLNAPEPRQARKRLHAHVRRYRRDLARWLERQSRQLEQKCLLVAPSRSTPTALAGGYGGPTC